MSTENIFIAHPSNNEQLNALKAILKALKIKFEVKKADESPYNTDFVEMVIDAENEIKEGKGTKVNSTDFDNLWK
jgi:hypothetical protein